MVKPPVIPAKLVPRGSSAGAVQGAASGQPEPSANDEIPQQLTDALAAGEDGHEKAGSSI